MKKNLFLVFILVFVVVFCLSGCGVGETFYAFAQGVENRYDDIVRGIDYYSDTPLYHNEDFKRSLSAASVALSESNIENIGEFSAMAGLVSRTVWGRAPMKVTFAVQDLKYGGVRTILFEDLETRRELDDNGLWRELYAAKLKLDVINQLKPLESSFNVVSVIVEWNQKQMFGSVLTHSVCDLDGDGVWDYYSPDLHYDRPAEEYEVEVESDFCKKRLLDDQYGSVVVVRSGKYIRDVPPLEHETFYDIQNAMKES